MTTTQVTEMLFKTKLEAVSEALKNNGGDRINHLHKRQVTPGSAISSSNLSSPQPDSISHKLDIKFLSQDFRLCNRQMLLYGFEYTAWLIQYFYLETKLELQIQVPTMKLCLEIMPKNRNLAMIMNFTP